MSLTIITGQTGSGKTLHAIDRCRAMLTAGESVCFITPDAIVTPDADINALRLRDPSIKALFELTQTETKFRLQTPIPIDEIDLKRTKHLVLDEVMLNPAGQHRFLGAINADQAPFEFSGLTFFKFAKRCLNKGCALTLITQELPTTFLSALDIHSDEVPFTITPVNYHRDVKHKRYHQKVA